MRILLVTNGLRYGGAERVVEALAVDLAARGDRVEVVATTRDGPIGERLRAAKIPVSVLGIRSPFDARVPIELARIARRLEAEVIHSHLAVSDIAAALASPAVTSARLISTIHNGGVELSRGKRSAWILALHRFQRLIAVSEAVRAAVVARSPLLDPIVVRPCLVDDRGPRLTRAQARAKLGVDPSTPLVLAVGRLAPVKGFDVLADAADRLATKDARVLVIGEGDRGPLLGRKIELQGAREDAAEILVAGDVIACPSRSEGFPQVPLQAMAAARPVVGSSVGGMTEVVLHGDTGLLVPPDDPGALAGALDALLSDAGRADRLGEAGRERLVREGLSRRAMVERTRAAYLS